MQWNNVMRAASAPSISPPAPLPKGEGNFRLARYFFAANFRATKYGTGSLPKAFKTVPPAVKT